MSANDRILAMALLDQLSNLHGSAQEVGAQVQDENLKEVLAEAASLVSKARLIIDLQLSRKPAPAEAPAPVTRYPAHPFITAWGRRMGSSVAYVNGERARAKADNAPDRAIYRDSEGHWFTVDDVSNQDALDFITDYVRERWPGHPALFTPVEPA